MTGNTAKPLICACCLLENSYSINNYTIAFTTDCIICDKNYHYQDLVLIDKDCKICKESLSKYFNITQSSIRAMCVYCATHTDICTTGKKSKFCSSYKILSNGFLWEIPIIRPDIINEPSKWEFKPHFCGYKIRFKDTSIKCLYSILDEKYKIVLRKQCKECNFKTCSNLDNKRWCVYHKYCTICGSYERNTDWFHECKNCGKAYCYGLYRPCGTSKYCKNCFIEQEKQHLLCLVKHIIDEKLIYDDIISVIFNYAYKHALICANYKKCKKLIISATSNLSFICMDYDCYVYEVKSEFVDQNAINNCSYINGRYIRTFCDECSDYGYGDVDKCKFCRNIEIGEICWNHPKYKCDECNKELFCDEKTDNLCRKCGQYSCGQCTKSKHKLCDKRCHPTCEKYAVTDRCEQCEIKNNRLIAAQSHLSPTANSFIPLSIPIMSPQQNGQIFQGNYGQLLQHGGDVQLLRQNELLLQHSEQLIQQSWQPPIQYQQLQLMPNCIMMNNANNYFGYELHYNCNNYCNNYNINQYQ